MHPPRERLGALDADAALPLIQGLTHLHDAVLLLDSEGRVSWMSDALSALCGGGSRILGQPLAAILADGEDGAALIGKLDQEGRVSNTPARLLGGDGHPVRAWISAARLGSRSECCPSVAILRLRDEPVAGVEMRAVRHSLNDLLDGSPDAVVVVDSSRFVTFVNPAMETLLGYERDDLLDKPLGLFVRRADDLERVAAALDPAHPVRNQDLELRHRDGHPLTVSVSANLVRLPDGSPLGTVAFLRDVTDRRRNQDDLERKNSELEHYVHAVSHDLRSPLVSLLGFTRLLREDFASRIGDKGVHFLNRVEQAGRTMENLIHDLLELSRIGRTCGNDDTRVDPRGVLLQLQAELKPRLDADGIELVLPENPPLLRCDRTRLYQLFSNLVGNALEHMVGGAGVESPRIEVAIDESGSDHVIRVSDNGCGIDPRDHERIFEIFQSLGPRSDGRRGTGIGLSIVKKIAETQGGSVEVESEPGRGASFRVRLPQSG